jgi:hypothetical protein
MNCCINELCLNSKLISSSIDWECMSSCMNKQVIRSVIYIRSVFVCSSSLNLKIMWVCIYLWLCIVCVDYILVVCMYSRCQCVYLCVYIHIFHDDIYYRCMCVFVYMNACMHVCVCMYCKSVSEYICLQCAQYLGVDHIYINVGEDKSAIETSPGSYNDHVRYRGDVTHRPHFLDYTSDTTGNNKCDEPDIWTYNDNLIVIGSI